MLVLGTKGMPINNLLQNEKRYRMAKPHRWDDLSRRIPTADARAAGIGRDAGLKRVYGGNIPGGDEDTGCPHGGGRCLSSASLSEWLEAR